ncbi:hypothetical protein PR048_032466 [Dryococelus australis]|uniref:FLYWCH-type domain-containing protein n=1 Tax=Dryococelus australis TaxID=614101 RepID=A0ABQ9G545_9NEOP|nr:hypothetical protein PR048_032466 [Dryococelus australis]
MPQGLNAMKIRRLGTTAPEGYSLVRFVNATWLTSNLWNSQLFFLSPLAGRFHFIKSLRGHVQLVCNNYLYTRNNQSGSKTFWRCIDYHRHKCCARGVTSGSVLELVTGHHIHPPHLDKIKRLQNQNFYNFQNFNRFNEPNVLLYVDTG